MSYWEGAIWHKRESMTKHAEAFTQTTTLYNYTMNNDDFSA